MKNPFKGLFKKKPKRIPDNILIEYPFSHQEKICIANWQYIFPKKEQVKHSRFHLEHFIRVKEARLSLK